MTKDSTVVVKTGTCVFCMNDNLELFWRDDELMCEECNIHFNEEDAMHQNDLEASLKYEAEEWIPEYGFDDEEDD